MNPRGCSSRSILPGSFRSAAWFCIAFFAGCLYADVHTWTGLAGDEKWSTAGNWSSSGGGAPAITDDALFNSGAVACSLAATTTINNITFTSDYSGVFQFRNRTLSVTGNADFSTGGTITTGTSGLLQFTGVALQNFTPKPAQTFPGVRQNGTVGTVILADLTAGALTIAKGELDLGTGRTHSVASVTNVTPSTGSINFGSSTLSITAGNATFTSIGVTAGSGKLVFARTGAQTFTPRAGGVFPDIEKINRGVLTVATRGFRGNALRILDGTITLGTNLADTVTKITGVDTLNFSSATLVVTGDTADFGSLAALTQGTGKLRFEGSGAQILIPRPNDTLPALFHAGSGTLRFSTNAIKTFSFTSSAGQLDFNGLNVTTIAGGALSISGLGASCAGLGGVTITAAGTASFSGQLGSRLNLNPTTDWTIAATGALNADQVTLANSHATKSPGTATNSGNEGNNPGWSFSEAKIWIGSSANGKWSSAGNWADGLVPAATDTVKFNGTSTANCTLDVSDTIAGIIFVSSYTGTFRFSSSSLRVTGTADFRMGGSIAGTGRLVLAGSSAQTLYPKAGATFATVYQDNSIGVTVSSAGLTADSLIVQTGTFDLGASLKHTIGSISGSGAMAFGACTLQVNGATADFGSFSSINAGTGRITFIGTAAQALIPPVDDTLPAIIQNGTVGTTIQDNGLWAGALTIAKGEFNCGSGLIHTVASIVNAAPSTGSINFGTSTLKVSSGNATFTSIGVAAGSGKLAFSRTGAQSFVPKAGAVFPDIEKTGGGILTVATRGFHGNALRITDGTVTLGTNLADTVTKVTGADTLNFSSATLVVTGDSADFGSLRALIQGTGNLRFQGSGTQVLIPRANDTLPAINHTSASTLLLSTNPVKSLGFSQTAGSIDCNGLSIATVAGGDFTVSNGGALTFINLGGTSITVEGNAALAGTDLDRLALNPDVPWSISAAGSLNADLAIIGNSDASGGAQGVATNSIDDHGNNNWAFSNAKIWDGEAHDGKWSTPLNWSDNGPPRISDTLKFNGTSVENCTLDVDDTIAGIILVGSYTGEFSFSGKTLRLTGAADFQTGGTVSGPGRLVLGGFSAQTLYANAGMPFPTVVQDNGAGAALGNSLTIDSLIVQTGTLDLGAKLKHTIGSISGSGGLAFSSCTLQVNGPMVDLGSFSSINPGTGRLHLIGAAAQTIVPPVDDTLPAILQNGSVRTTIQSNGLSAGALTIAKGQFDCGSGLTHTVASITNASPNTGSVNFGSSTLQVSSGNATFTYIGVTAGTGKLSFSRTGAQTFVAKAGAVFPDIEKTGSGVLTIGTRGFRASALRVIDGTVTLGTNLSDTVAMVSGSDTLNFSSATLVVTGDTADFGSMAQVVAGTGSLKFVGTGTQVIIPRDNDTIPPIIHNGTGTLMLSSRELITANLTQTAGKIDFNNNNLSVAGGNLAISAGDPSTFVNLAGRLIRVSGNASLAGQIGNLLNLNPDGAWTIDVMGSLNADYAKIGNSNASRSQGIATNSNDSLNNSNWIFSGAKAWDGGAGNNLWSDPVNWTDDISPSVNDTVKFNGTFPYDCVLDIDDTVAGAIFVQTYARTFSFSSNVLTVMGDADLRSAGSFIGSGALRFTGTKPHTFYPKSGGSIPGVIQDGDSATSISTTALSVGTLNIQTGALKFIGALKHTASVVKGSGSLVFSACTLQVTDTADFSSFASVTVGTGVLSLTGTSPQLFLTNSARTLPAVLQNGTGGTTIQGSGLKCGALIIAKGELHLGSGLTNSATTVAGVTSGMGSINFGSSTLQLTGAANFSYLSVTPGTGTLTFAGTGSQAFTPKLGANFPDIRKTGSGTTTVTSRGFNGGKLDISGGTFALGGYSDTLTGIKGSGTINFATGTIVMTGDTANFGAMTVTHGTGALKFTSASTQVLVPRLNDTLPAITHSGTGILRLSTYGLQTAAFTNSAGRIDLNGINLTTLAGGNLTASPGDSLTFMDLAGCTVSVAGNATFNGEPGNLVDLKGSAPWVINATGTLTANRAAIKNSLATGSIGLATNSADSGGNDRWNFSYSRIWDGGGGNGKWSVPENWSDDELPNVNDTIMFTSSFVGACTLDIADTIAGISFSPGYTGNFCFSTNKLLVKGNADFQSGGSVTGAGTLEFTGSSAHTFIPKSGTAFANVVQNGTGATTISTNALTATTVTVQTDTLYLGSALKHAVTTITGAGALAFGSCTLQVSGTTVDFSTFSGITAGTGLLMFTGTSAQQFTPRAGSTFPAIMQKGPGGTTIQGANLTAGTLNISQGEFNIGENRTNTVSSVTYSTPNTGSINFGSSTLKISGAANFTYIGVTANAGTLEFSGAGTQAFTPKAGAIFPDIVKSGAGTTNVTSRGFHGNNLSITGGTFAHGGYSDTITDLSGTGKMSFTSGKMIVTGDTADFNSLTVTHGTGALIFTAASQQVLIPRLNDTLPAITHSGSGTLQLSANPLMAAAFTNGSSAGGIDVGGQNITTVGSGNFTINGTASTFANLEGCTITVAGSASFVGQEGNLLNMKAPAQWTISAATGLTATYATIGNSHATGTAAGIAIFCVDSGGNDRWIFSYTRNWDGGAGNGKWSAAANWSGDEIPTVNDTVIFDGSFTGACTLDVADTISGVRFDPAYSGNFNFSANELSVLGNVDFRTGGSIAGTGTLRFAGSTAHSFIPKSGATFPAIRQDGLGSTTISTNPLIATAVTVSLDTLYLGSGLKHAVSSLEGTGTLAFGSCTLQVAGSADFSSLAAVSPGTGVLEFTAASAQDFMPPSGVTFPKVVQSGSGGTTIKTNALSATTLTIAHGTLDLGKYLAHSVTTLGAASPNNGVIAFDSSTLQISGAANFGSIGVTANAGTLEFSGAGTQAFTPKAGAVFPDIVKSGAGTTNVTSRGFRGNKLSIAGGTFAHVSYSDTVSDISGTGKMTFTSGKMIVTGDTADFGSMTINHGTGSLIFNAASLQVLVPRSADTLPAITHSGTGTLRLSSNPLMAAAFTNGSGAGGIDLNGQDIITVNGGNLTINGTAATFANLGGRAITVAGSASFTGQAGNRLNMNATAPWTISAATGLTATYATIGNSHATGTAAGVATHSADSGGNDRWTFSYTRNWDGGAGNGKWSAAANWSDDELPTINDTVIFDGSFTGACTLDIADTVSCVRFDPAYAGNFSFSTNELSVLARVDFRSGGSIAGTGTLRFAGSLAHSFIPKAGATFPTIKQDGLGATTISTNPLTATAVTISLDTLYLGSGLKHTVSSLSGAGTLVFGSCTLQVAGSTDFSGLAAVSPGTGVLAFTAASAQDFVPRSGVTFPAVVQNGSGGTTIKTNALSATTLTIAHGALDLGKYLTHSISTLGSASPSDGAISFDSSTLQISGAANFGSIGVTPVGGTLVFSGSGAQAFTPKAGAIFPDIRKSGAGTTTVTSRAFRGKGLTVSAGTFALGSYTDTVTRIAGSGTLTFGSGTLAVTGDTADFHSLTVPNITGALRFDGTAAQVLVPRANDTLPAITHAGAGTLQLSTNPLLTASFVNNAGAGGIDLGGRNVTTVSGDFTINGTASTFANLGGSTIAVAGAASFTGTVAGYLNIDPASLWTINASGTLSATYASLQWSHATGTAGVARNCNDKGNNDRWSFSGTRLWTNIGGDGKWSTAANWSGSYQPTVTDTVQFDATSTASCSLDISDTIASIVMQNTYSGVLGFRAGDSLTVNDKADFRSGGAIAAGSGYLQFIGSAPQSFYPAGGTYGWLLQKGAGGTTAYDGALNATTLDIEAGTFHLGAGQTHSAGTVMGSGGLDFGSSILQISGAGNFASLDTVICGSATLEFTGTNAKTFDPLTGDTFPAIAQKAGTTTLQHGLIAKGLTIAGGIFALGTSLAHSVASIGSSAPGTGTIDFGSSSLSTTGNADFTAIGVTAGTGSLRFSGTAQQFVPRAGAQFPELMQNNGAGTTTVTTRAFNAQKLTIAAGTFNLGASAFADTVARLVAQGSIGFSACTLHVTGDTADFGSSANVEPGTGAMWFDGSGTQLLVPPASDTLPGMLHSGTGTLKLAINPAVMNSFTQTGGKLDFNGSDISIVNAGDFSVTNGNGLTFVNLGARAISVEGSATFTGQLGDLLNMDPSDPWTIDVTGADLTADYADIANSTALSRMGEALATCHSGGGNHNWHFVGLDSLMISSVNLMPTDTLWERQKNIPALRLIIRYPDASGNTREITRIEFAMTPNPATSVGKKMLRIAGQMSNFYSSSTIEPLNPMVMDLSASPIRVHPSDIDTYDVYFDVAGTPADSVVFSVTNSAAFTARDSVTASLVDVKGDGVAFPLVSATGRINGGTATPSSKYVDGSLADWSTDERIDRYNFSESFYATWDKTDFYFAWSGTNLSAGDLFLYISTATTGDSMTWSYSDTNHHKIDSTFRKARYLYYYDDASNNGLRDGTNGYGALAFNGEVATSGTITEIRIPFSDLGNPDSIRIIPFIQQEGGSDILVSVPHDAAGEMVRNPIGKAQQKFISWFRLKNSALGQTPTAIARIDNASVVTPTWTYSLQPSGSYATSISVGYNDIYVSVAGSNKKVTSINSNGTLKWETGTYASPVTAVATYTAPTGTNVVMFCEGNNFRAFYDDASHSELSYSPIDLGSRGGNPSRSFPPDGGALDTVFAYVPCENGKLYKIRVDEDDGGFIYDSTADINASPDAGVAVAGDRVIVGCTDGNVYSFSFDAAKRFGASINADVGDSINKKITYSSGLATIYCTPRGNYLVARKAADLSPKWSYDMGGAIYAGAYVYTSVKPHQLFCPVEDSMKYVRDDTTKARWFWTRPTTGTISTDPVMSSSVVYFSSDDKRNFAVNAGTGAVRNGWPTAVLSQAGRTRIAVDGTTSSVYFGGGDGKIYRYPKQ